MEQARHAVRESYLRVCETGDFFSDFYARFFARSPIAAETFSDTSIARQKVALRAALEQAVLAHRDEGSMQAMCARLAESHGPRGHKIHTIFYLHWLDSLCETLAVHDADWSETLERQWRLVIGELIERICICHTPFAAD